MTPLSYACRKGKTSFDLIRLLFDHGGSVAYGQLLHYAVARTDNDRFDIMQYLLDRGAPINEVMYSNHHSKWFFESAPMGTPLHWAAEQGATEMALFLLDHGADPTIKNTHGHTPSEVAEKCKKSQVGDLLRSRERSRPRSSFLAALGWG